MVATFAVERFRSRVVYVYAPTEACIETDIDDCYKDRNRHYWNYQRKTYGQLLETGMQKSKRITKDRRPPGNLDMEIRMN